MSEKTNQITSQINGATTTTTWYENGQKMCEENYRGYRLHGVFTYWYEDGKPISQEHYIDGHLNGLCRYWNADGRKIFEKYYAGSSEVTMFKMLRTQVINGWIAVTLLLSGFLMIRDFK